MQSPFNLWLNTAQLPQGISRFISQQNPFVKFYPCASNSVQRQTINTKTFSTSTFAAEVAAVLLPQKAGIPAWVGRQNASNLIKFISCPGRDQLTVSNNQLRKMVAGAATLLQHAKVSERRNTASLQLPEAFLGNKLATEGVLPPEWQPFCSRHEMAGN